MDGKLLMDLIIYILAFVIVAGIAASVTFACMLSGRASRGKENKRLKEENEKLKIDNDAARYGDVR